VYFQIPFWHSIKADLILHHTHLYQKTFYEMKLVNLNSIKGLFDLTTWSTKNVVLSRIIGNMFEFFTTFKNNTWIFDTGPSDHILKDSHYKKFLIFFTPLSLLLMEVPLLPLPWLVVLYENLTKNNILIVS